MLNLIKSPVLRQFAIVLIANLSIVNLGLSTVWSSPMLVKLRDEDQNILQTPIKVGHETWITSISLLVGIVSMTVTGSIMDFIGRKNSMLLAYAPRFAQCIFAIFANDVWMILTSRAFAGVADFASLSVASTYVSEVAGKKIRGASGTMTQIMSALGIMLMFSIGPFVSYLAINITMTCIAVVLFIPLWFIPESPAYLYRKGKTDESLKVLTFLWGSEEVARQEQKEYDRSDDEFQENNKWELLKDPIVLKSFFIIVVLTVGTMFTGYNAVNLYLQTIFELTQSSISSEISSLIIGCITLISCICTFFISDKFGRKTIICTSLFLMSLGMIGLGTFFFLSDQGSEITGFLNVLPLISIAIIIYGFSAGIGSLIYILMAEVMIAPLRSYGVSMGIFTGSSCTVLLLFIFPTLIGSLGGAITFWMFAVGNIALAIIIMFLVPETKGKSFREIQTALGRTDEQIFKDEKVMVDVPSIRLK